MSRIHEALKRAELGLETSNASSTLSPIPDGPLTDAFVKTISDTAQLEVPLPPGRENRSNRDAQVAEWLSKIAASEWKSDSKKLLFSDTARHYEPGMEEFRTLRSRLYQLREKIPLKTIMVASALPGEGKTFVSSNLAYVLARQQGRRVLMIDADVRKPHMHECIGTRSTPGLNDYLSGKADERAIVQRGSHENLYLIPGGLPVSNPSELVANGRLKQLLELLAPSFHWILIDSPPVVPISDGSMIAKYSDGVLLVVRAEETPVDLVQRAKQELKDRPLLGVVLNRAAEKSARLSYYYPYNMRPAKAD